MLQRMKANIGRYRVEGMIGEGGMGVVYAARDEALGRAVAIKVLRELHDPAARERFRREARAAAAVNHPNICHIYEVGEDEGTIFLAMERLDGEPLSVRLQRGPMPLDEVVPVALGVLAALDALHARGIVHRDLKPANVFLTPHGVKLLDFGLAHAAGLSGATALGIRVTATGMVTGTPHYMSPEQLQGSDVGPVSDQFAFGALLFEMLSGRQAFAGQTVWEVSHAVLYGRTPALTGGSAAAALDRVIARCLEKRAEDRYADPSAIARDIRAAAAARDTDASHAIVRATTRLMVVPLRLLRPDPDIEFLSFSLADSLVESLAGLGTLVVRSAHAAQRFVPSPGAPLDLEQIAREGQVDAVLTGTLLRAGDRVRLTAQLVEAPGGTILWSRTAEVRMGDVFQLQDDLVRQVIESLSIPLTAGDRQRMGRDVPATGRAYELYLRANHLAHGTVAHEPLVAARDLYRAALDEDPGYAPAWARLGRVYRVLAKYSGHLDEENVRLAGEAFDRAFALSPDLPLAHHLYTHFEIEQLARPEAAMIRLLGRVRDNPNDPDLFAGLVVACRFCGLLEASVAASERARHLDPALGTSVQHTYFLMHDLERLRRADYPQDPWLTGLSLAQGGDVEEGRRLLRMTYVGAAKVERMFVEMLEAAADGRAEEAQRLAATIRATAFRDPEGLSMIALVLSRAGLRDDAIALLEQVVDAGYTCPQLRDQPWFAPLVGDERFEHLIRQAEGAREKALAAFEGAGGRRLLGM
jgi:eukaryotic-like serine/threonine-protein kinase